MKTEENQAEKLIKLRKVGFEHGKCSVVQLKSDVDWLEIEYSQRSGVQKFSFGNTD